MRPNFIIILTISSLMMFTNIFAGSKIVPIDGINYTINTTIMENLSRLNGKKVTITLDGGKMLAGRIKSVGNNLLHLEKIERKEFFDALIRIDKIQAIEAQFRQYQR